MTHALRPLRLPSACAAHVVTEDDILAAAVARAPTDGAATLLVMRRPGLLAFAVVLEPDRPLPEARQAFFAGMAAVADALAAHCPPDRAVQIVWPDEVRHDRARIGGGRFAVAPCVTAWIRDVNPETAEFRNNAEPGQGPVWSLAIADETLLTGGADGVIRRWSLATGAPLGTGAAPPTAVHDDGSRGAQVWRACAVCHTLTPTTATAQGRRCTGSTAAASAACRATTIPRPCARCPSSGRPRPSPPSSNRGRRPIRRAPACPNSACPTPRTAAPSPNSSPASRGNARGPPALQALSAAGGDKVAMLVVGTMLERDDPRIGT